MTIRMGIKSLAFILAVLASLSLPRMLRPEPTARLGEPGGIMSISDAPDTFEGTGDSMMMAIFTVSIVWSGTATATVDYHTYPGTATEGRDYIGAHGTLTFTSMNHTPQQIAVKIIGDREHEPTETFDVKLSNPQNGSLGTSKGHARILDDDGKVPTRRVD